VRHQLHGGVMRALVHNPVRIIICATIITPTAQNKGKK
jgi:hypothetical protein